MAQDSEEQRELDDAVSQLEILAWQVWDGEGGHGDGAPTLSGEL